jgi:hypothetical protein
MKKNTICVFAIACLVLFFSGGLQSAAGWSLAKITPIWNLDEPGREPWEVRAELTSLGCVADSDCSEFTSGLDYFKFDLPTIPAKKRWVVQTVSGVFKLSLGQNLHIELTSGPYSFLRFDNLKWAFGGPFFAGFPDSSLIFNANLFVTFGPGETPSVIISKRTGPYFYSVIVFSGYLIDG